MALHFDRSVEPDGARIVLRGELDLAGVSRAEATLADVEAEGPEAIVLDLSGLEFMDSTGLRFVLAADQRARRGGWRLALVPGPPRVHRVFRVTGVDRRLAFTVEPAADREGEA